MNTQKNYLKKKFSATQRVLAAKEKYPNMTNTQLSKVSNTSIATVNAINYVLKWGIPEIQEIMRKEKSNASYCYKFVSAFPEHKQRELIKMYGVDAIKKYINNYNQKRSQKYRSINKNTINIF